MKEITREQYEEMFADYPGVVNLQQFREMLGGISRGMAYELMRGDYVEHFVIRTGYMIPKTCVIDYLLSPHYHVLQLKLTRHIRIDTDKDND